MAGIGFELKKLFNEKGVMAKVRAWGCASVICTGPMLLGILLVFGLMLICEFTGIQRTDREYLVCTITTTLVGSMLVFGFFSMVVTRFLADMLYEKKMETIIPSFWGSSATMLVVGGAFYGTFLFFSGISTNERLLLFILFEELIVVWNAMNYLSAIRDYKSILTVFSSAVLLVFGLGYFLVGFWHLPVQALLVAVNLGYGWIMVWDIALLHRNFPQDRRFESSFRFLRWFDKFFSLGMTGFLMNVGLFAHMVIVWLGPTGVNVRGAFFAAPGYDVPAFIALLTTLVTSINFVVSVEVNFYPKYRTYFALFNASGSVQDIKQAEREMLTVLNTELKYTALLQLVSTVLSIAVLGEILKFLPLGFDDMMFGCLRTLCVGYGMYAVGNTVLLLLLYFTDYLGAVISAAVFSVSTILCTLLSLYTSEVYLGFGFLIGSAAFFAVTYWRLISYTRRLPYHILSKQPIVENEKFGLFSKLEHALAKKGSSLHGK